MNKNLLQLHEQTLETAICYLSRRDDGIIFMQIKDNVSIDVQSVKEVYRIFHQLIGEGDCVLLLHTGKGAVMSKEARDFAFSTFAGHGIIAQAIIVNNQAHKLMANFFIEFLKFPKPTEMFTTKKEAIQWLRTMVPN